MINALYFILFDLYSCYIKNTTIVITCLKPQHICFYTTPNLWYYLHIADMVNYHEFSCLNNANLFCTDLEGRKPKLMLS